MQNPPKTQRKENNKNKLINEIKNRKDKSQIAKQKYIFGNTEDGWMTCDFTSFSTVFQSYQDDGRMIMKYCVQWNPVCDWKAGLELTPARSVGQRLTHWATGVSFHHRGTVVQQISNVIPNTKSIQIQIQIQIIYSLFRIYKQVIVILWFVRLHEEIIHDLRVDYLPCRWTNYGITNLYHPHQCRPRWLQNTVELQWLEHLWDYEN